MKKSQVGYFIIGSAIVWGFVMIGASFILKGTDFKEAMSLLLLGGFMTHLLFIWAPLAIHIKKIREQDKEILEENKE